MTLTLPFATPQELSPDAPTRPLADVLNGMSEDEFFAFCQANPHARMERRADGTIELSDMTGGTTGRRNAKLISRLDRWAEDTGLGQVFDSSTGFRLPSGAVRSPDAAWVSAAAWAALTPEQQEKFPPLCPEFVVELLSVFDSPTALTLKAQEYLDNGCRLLWLINSQKQTARVFRANGSVSLAESFDETLSGEDVLPGFAFSLSLLK